MRKVKNFVSMLWELAKGKKTYAVAICALVYGVYAKDKESASGMELAPKHQNWLIFFFPDSRKKKNKNCSRVAVQT